MTDFIERDPIVIACVARTPMAGFQGDVVSLTCPQFGAAAINAVLQRGRTWSPHKWTRW
ncbi:Acetyl-CoA acetyltransferase (EC 2.3.1.9) [Mycetohabitans rhizoxinica HKI 454]|uniref:Acetyl-CoA acetyltransferase n=1 Tax=Mycetohabitans rhizoxinica (strain DSM 19002 / CIP 109453 / HKI 454) TaxID=882378 RepID=E5AMK6_MYCRK|nr:Acetyl-CoA acetyltransferase (EC 2.3.1.9) [Mycetohabitans rhizoxinica HKI 454]